MSSSHSSFYRLISQCLGSLTPAGIKQINNTDDNYDDDEDSCITTVTGINYKDKWGEIMEWHLSRNLLELLLFS